MRPPIKVVCVQCGWVGSAQAVEIAQAASEEHALWCAVQIARRESEREQEIPASAAGGARG